MKEGWALKIKWDPNITELTSDLGDSFITFIKYLIYTVFINHITCVDVPFQCCFLQRYCDEMLTASTNQKNNMGETELFGRSLLYSLFNLLYLIATYCMLSFDSHHANRTYQRLPKSVLYNSGRFCI